MLVRIDKEADVIYARWGRPESRVFSKEVSQGIFLEQTEDGTVVGVEVLSASTRAAERALDHVDVEIFSGELVKS